MGRSADIAKFLQPIFVQNNWMYYSEDYNDLRIPSLEDLKSTLKQIKKSAKKAKGTASTGRLMAKYDIDSNKIEYYLSLDLT